MEAMTEILSMKLPKGVHVSKPLVSVFNFTERLLAEKVFTDQLIVTMTGSVWL